MIAAALFACLTTATAQIQPEISGSLATNSIALFMGDTNALQESTALLQRLTPFPPSDFAPGFSTRDLPDFSDNSFIAHLFCQPLLLVKVQLLYTNLGPRFSPNLGYN